MDLDYSADERAFRDEVRQFLADELPDDIAAKVRTGHELDKSDHERWQAILHARGWLAQTWPEEHGGPGWSPVQRHIFDEEAALADAPRLVPFGLNMLGPVVIEFGTAEQQAEILPRILDGTNWWCQGYSEPDAGSDLASLRTRAVRDGDHYVVNGQKTWTTLGQHADRIFCLVRTTTEGKPQAGISFLLMDLDDPGIEMRPIRLIEGGYEVNEVFFTDVHVPVDNLVGEENAGWTIAKFLLTHERTNIAGVGYATRGLARLRRLADEVVRGGRPLADDPVFAARLVELEARLEAMKVTNLRMLSEVQAGGSPGAASSMLKITGTQLRQAINDLTRRALGPAAAPMPHVLPDGAGVASDDFTATAAHYFNNRKLSIYGGSNEIQRNILSRQLLGS